MAPYDTEGRLSVEVDGIDHALSLKVLLEMFWRRIWFIVLSVVFATGAAIGISFLMTPQYEASITVLVGQDRGFTETPNDALGIQTLTQTMAATVSSTRVAEAVIQELDLQITSEDFLENLNVEQVPETQLVEVSYTDPSANDAQLIVNTVGEVFSEQIDEAAPDSSAVTAVTWDEAPLPEEPASPDPIRNGLLGLIAGLFVGVCIVGLLEIFDDSWRSPEELERISGVPTFGVIPQFKSVRSGRKKGAGTSRESDEERYPSTKLETVTSRKTPVASSEALPLNETASWPYFGTVLLDRQGRIKKCNPTMAQMLGFDGEALRDEKLASFASHPDDVAVNESLQDELAEGKRDGYQIEKRLIAQNGQVMWVQLSVSKIEAPEDESQFAFGTVDDISSKKQAEEELRLSEEARRFSDARLNAFLERSPFAIRTFSADGQPLMNGGAWDDFWGYSLDEEESYEDANLFNDERIEDTGLVEYVRSSLSSGEVVATPVLPLNGRGNANGSVENAAMESDRRWFKAFVTPIVGESGRISEIAVALSDVTENKQIEEELESARLEQRNSEEALETREKILKEREERFRSLVEIVTSPMNGNAPKEGS